MKEEKKKTGRVTRALRWVLVIVILLCVTAIGTWYYVQKQYKDEMAALQAVAKAAGETEADTLIEETETISGATLEAGLRDIGKLETAEYYFTHVINYESAKQFHGFTLPLTKASFIYSYDCTITAGVDFGTVIVNKDDEAKTIEILLPSVETLSAEVDPDSFKLYDEKNNIFNPISVENVTDSFAELVGDEEQKAIDGGLYERARANAVTLIENFVGASYDVGDYKITVS